MFIWAGERYQFADLPWRLHRYFWRPDILRVGGLLRITSFSNDDVLSGLRGVREAARRDSD